MTKRKQVKYQQYSSVIHDIIHHRIRCRIPLSRLVFNIKAGDHPIIVIFIAMCMPDNAFEWNRCCLYNGLGTTIVLAYDGGAANRVESLKRRVMPHKWTGYTGYKGLGYTHYQLHTSNSWFRGSLQTVVVSGYLASLNSFLSSVRQVHFCLKSEECLKLPFYRGHAAMARAPSRRVKMIYIVPSMMQN